MTGVQTPTSSVRVCEGQSPLLVAILGRFDAENQAGFEVEMRAIRQAPRDVVYDVSAVERLDVEGILLLAEHAQWLRSRSRTVSLRGAALEVEQLIRLLGYERAFGLG